MDDFCREKGIRREYSVSRTPQQNGVAERRNRTLIKVARTIQLQMLALLCILPSMDVVGNGKPKSDVDDQKWLDDVSTVSSMIKIALMIVSNCGASNTIETNHVDGSSVDEDEP
ncbi:putative ribonuclease H-like domain-containing protein [Tanacetum coccineum]